MPGAAGFLVSSSIRRRHGGAIILRFLSRLQISASPLPLGLQLLRRLSTDRDSCVFSAFPPPPPDGDICGAGGFRLEIVDDEAWKVSSALSHAWRPPDAGGSLPKNGGFAIDGDFHGEREDFAGDSFGFDEIEEMRLRKKLFYKMDKGSMEGEECSIDLFSRQKSKSKKKKKRNQVEDPASSREKQVSREKKIPKPSPLTISRCKSTGISPWNAAAEEKRKSERTPTFNQLTDPYHLPFCLDLFISKGSVRACIVHRATSKVVAVAHSISKDMKFDLSSRRDAAACAAVGSALAQRALSDDIHNVVYSPRKGEKIEGKLHIVLQSMLDAGIDVKIKIKQRKPLKGRDSRPIPKPEVEVG